MLTTSLYALACALPLAHAHSYIYCTDFVRSNGTCSGYIRNADAVFKGATTNQNFGSWNVLAKAPSSSVDTRPAWHYLNSGPLCKESVSLLRLELLTSSENSVTYPPAKVTPGKTMKLLWPGNNHNIGAQAQKKPVYVYYVKPNKTYTLSAVSPPHV